MRYFVCLLLTVFLTSCIQDTFEDCEEHYFSETFKSYVFHKPESYWIYNDTLHGETDSLYLIEQKVDFHHERCTYSGPPTEYLRQKYFSSFFASSDSFTLRGAALTKTYNDNFKPPTGYFSSRVDSNNNFLVDKHDFIKVQGKKYYEVMEFKRRKRKVFWAQNVGVIKKVFPDPENEDKILHFELVRFTLK